MMNPNQLSIALERAVERDVSITAMPIERRMRAIQSLLEMAEKDLNANALTKVFWLMKHIEIHAVTIQKQIRSSQDIA